MRFQVQKLLDFNMDIYQNKVMAGVDLQKSSALLQCINQATSALFICRSALPPVGLVDT